ncbi:MAG: hypothetical protein LBF59_05445 [Prevotellaceae bacterium]|nr:hypothetical protein [Prevotellaceae bacterium]
METQSWRRNHGDAIHGDAIMETQSWRRNHGDAIMETQNIASLRIDTFDNPHNNAIIYAETLHVTSWRTTFTLPYGRWIFYFVV